MAEWREGRRRRGRGTLSADPTDLDNVILDGKLYREN
jgi:hypothetical protein